MAPPKDPLKYALWQQRQTAAKLKNWQDPDYRKRLSEAHMGQVAWNKGIPMSAEARSKLSETQHNYSPEKKAELSKKIGEAAKGRKQSEETIRKRTAKMMGENNPQKRPEVKEKTSNGLRKMWAEMPKEDKDRRLKPLIESSLNIKISSLEVAIASVLDILNEPYQQQYPLFGFYADFYLPNRNIVVECNGEYWHSRPERKHRDKVFTKLCIGKGIKILFLQEAEIKKDSKSALINGLNLIESKWTDQISRG